MENQNVQAAAAPGWYPDPSAAGKLRYWNGSAWTEQVADGAIPAAAAKPASGKATASLVLGIIGLVAWYIPLFGLPITVIGLVMGFSAKKVAPSGKVTAGIVLSIIGLVLSVINAAAGAYLAAIGVISV